MPDPIELEIGVELSNAEVCDRFSCSPQGGMRRALATNSLVLISKHIDNVYDDRWLGKVFHYTGMGLKGDQSLAYMQNKTLAESGQNGIAIHLFESFAKNAYTYMGQVDLADSPYEEAQLDEDGRTRTVWVFPLRVSGGLLPALPQEKLRVTAEKKAKQAATLTDEELAKRAAQGRTKPGRRATQSDQYDRNAWVSEYAQRRAGGSCQLCNQPAPFKRKNGTPYLETHHIEHLARGGADTIENTTALCPNCHRRMHIVDDEDDIATLKNSNRTDLTSS